MAGRPGEAPFVTGTGAGTGGDGVSSDQMSDPLPQALILTAIVITFAVSAFLLALIYRSWRLSTEDSLEDDESDVAMRTGHTSIPGLEADASELDTEFGAPPA
jgi:multisubunit Na+/H+ antiporter MnhC subunit